MQFSIQKGYVYILLNAVIFSSVEITLKLSAGAFDPIQITMLRFLIGGLILLPFSISSLKQRGLKIAKSDFKHFMLTGLLFITFSMTIYQIAITYTQASVVAVVFSGNPIFVTILAYFFLKETITKHNIAALFLEICGIIAIINPFHNEISLRGIVLTVISALIFALYAVASRDKAKYYGGLTVSAYSFIFGGLQLLALILLAKIPAIDALLPSVGLSIFRDVPLLAGLSLETMPLFFCICVINTAFGFYCYMKALELTSAHEVSITFFLKPVLAPIFAVILIHEYIPFNMMIGIGFFLAASLISLLPQFKQVPDASPGRTE